MNAEERLGIQEVIAHFSNSFDAKDWSGLEACLTESLYTDYGDLRAACRAAMIVWRKSETEKSQARARKMIAEGKMTSAGLASLPEDFDQRA